MKVAFGTYNASGAPLSITGIGFQPDLVIVCSQSGQSDSLFKTSQMPGNQSLGIRGDTAAITNGIVSLDADGFSLGTNALGNNPSTVYTYQAYKNDGSGDFGVVSYLGTGATQSITGFGFQPTFLQLKGNQALTGCFRFSTAPTDSTSIWYTDQNQSGMVTSLDSNGFTLGSSGNSNANGVTFYGFAFKQVDGRAYCFQYTGNGSNATPIANPGFLPGFILVKSQNTSDAHVFRTLSHTSTNSQPYTGGEISTGIESITNQGFTIGTSGSVNTSSKLYNCFVIYNPTQTLAPAFTPSYIQPALPARIKGWHVNSVDLQVATKEDAWNQGHTERMAEYAAVAALGMTHVALAVPYNTAEATKFANYVADARASGLSIIFRSHWNEWEGDNSFSPGQCKQDYLDRTYEWIVSNPTFFQAGDLFATCVECNNADSDGTPNAAYPFRVGNLVGGSFDMAQYNQFLKNQVAYANAAFAAIGVTDVSTFPISMSVSLLNLNGQNLSATSGNSQGLGDADIATNFGGILTIDHYLGSAYNSSKDYGATYSSDLDKIHAAFPSCKLFIGEWGYSANSSVSDAEQYATYKEVVKVLISKPYICGVNFWVHAFSNTASLFDDNSGTIITPGRPATLEITEAFNQINTRSGSTARSAAATRSASTAKSIAGMRRLLN